MKYCGKCGHEINPETGLCPKCDKKKLTPNLNKKLFGKGVIIAISLLLVVAITLSILIVFGLIKFPFVGNSNNVLKTSDNMFVTTPNEKNVKYDEESGIPFIDNEVLITFTKETNEFSAKETIQKYNGKILGVIATTNTYQVQINVCENYSQLTSVITKIEQENTVEFASPDLLIICEPDYYPHSDVHWANEWDTIPAGGNWGIEAIKAPAAWDYLQEMQDVNIGVMDGQFLNHEDLHFERIFLNSNNKSEGYEHGTHVSGTIGAGFDNKIGISGVCPKSKLYGFSIVGTGTAIKKVTSNGEEDITYLVMYELGLANLIPNCKVVNISQNTGRTICYAASQGDLLYGSLAQTYLITCANEIEKYLSSLVKNGKEFTIVVAAGNVNTIRFEKDESQEFREYPYFGYKQVSKGGKSGGALAKYNNFLNTIETKEIKDRIIVVGAIKNETVGTNESFSYCDFSNIGDRVDVVAPGYEIESTVDNNEYKSKDWSGTSMAAPHVAGIAAMLYSVNPNLKGSDVKKIICETATRKVDGFNLVDAEASVKRALQASVSGKVVSSKNNKALADVNIAVYKSNDSNKEEIANSFTDKDGNFEISLSAGEYDFEFTKKGYKAHTTGAKLDKGVITVLKDEIVLEPNTVDFVNDKYLVKCDDVIYGVDVHGLWKNEGGYNKDYLTKCSATNLATDGQVIYYSVLNNSTTNQYDLYQYDIETGSNEKVTSFVQCGVPIFAEGEMIYYTDFPENRNEQGMAHSLYSYNTSSGEKKHLGDGAQLVGSYDGKIFYRDVLGSIPSVNSKNKWGQIYCYDTKTEESNMISDGGVMSFTIESGKLLYNTLQYDTGNSRTSRVSSYDILSGKTDVLFEKTNNSIEVEDYDEKYVVYSETRMDGSGFVRFEVKSKTEDLLPRSKFNGDLPSKAMRDSDRTIFYTDNTGGIVYTMEDGGTNLESTISSYIWQTMLALKEDTVFAVTNDSKNYYEYYISCGRAS